MASDITGISYDPASRLKLILETISSRHIIDPEKFNKHAICLYDANDTQNPLLPISIRINIDYKIILTA